MTLITATGERLERILDGTFTIWSEGLTRDAYSRWNRGQMETAWGRDRLRRVALVHDDEVLASAKRYDFEAWLGGEHVDVLGIGAVFTPPPLRGRGYARALIEAMIDDARGRGCALALLFSEIGPEFYEALDFRVVPRSILTIETLTKPGAPAVLMRAVEAADLPLLAEISARYGHHADFALERSPALIAFSATRRRLLAGLGAPGVRQVEFFVTEEGHRAVAYVLLTRGPTGVFLEECGDRDPTGARIGAMLQVIAARTPAEGPLRMRAWLPARLRPPQIQVLAEKPADEVMMVRELRPGTWLGTMEHFVFWNCDVF